MGFVFDLRNRSRFQSQALDSDAFEGQRLVNLSGDPDPGREAARR